LRKVLILGHGFIGENLAKNLDSTRLSVFLLSKTSPSTNQSFTGVWTQDLATLDRDSPIFKNEYDTIFHVASSTTPGSSDLDMPFDVSSNLLGTLKFLENLRSPEKTKFVFISSAGTIYGPLNKPATEKSPTDPICSYGITKLAIEKYLSLFHQKRGLRSLILRVSNPYGPWNLARKPFGLVNNLVDNLVSGKPVVTFGDMDTSRDFIYIDDLIEAIIGAAFSDAPAGTYNLAFGQSRSIDDVLNILRDEFGHFPVEKRPAREFDLTDVRVDSSLFQKTFSWRAKTDLNQGIRKTLDFRKSHGSFSKS
jgi:UDP-glucose 4-epimerase